MFSSKRPFFSFQSTQILLDSPKAILSVGLFLVNVGRLPVRFELVVVFPEVDEKVRDLACRGQEPLQVECVVTGETKAPR